MLMPTSDRIVVEPITPPDDTTAGGIILVPGKEKVPTEGIIRAIGPKCIELNVGDKILLPNKHVGTEITFEGKQLKLYRESDIQAILP